MIYEKIANYINDILGADYLIEYANNHDTDWNSILPEAQDQIKYGVLRVDSGTTVQAGGQTIQVEQLRLIVAIPEERDIFNAAVHQLRGLLINLNGDTVTDSSVNLTALMYAGNYQDAQSQTCNGNRWWVAEVTFSANFNKKQQQNFGKGIYPVCRMVS